ncbi:IS110 family transposase [bacterium]|nr:IS110 family transposase [bacterium]
MRILAIDLGKEKSVACDYLREDGTYEFVTVPTSPDRFRELLSSHPPDRIVIEICPIAGWVCDLVRRAGIEIHVAKTTEQAWRWKNVKRKTDRDDALKLAQLSSLNQIKLVHVPELPIRQWRSLITYRHGVVARRTQVKNRIKAILMEQAESPSYGTHYAWTKTHQDILRKLARPIGDCHPEELWRGELSLELDQLTSFDQQIDKLDQRLEVLGNANPQVRLLRTIPGVGPRLAETIVAVIDGAGRFTKGKQVACYAGLTPRQFQSGQSDRLGNISHAGSGLLRGLLVEVSWMGLRYNSWLRELFERVCRGSKARRKLAIVAVARHLLICCWAMLRDGKTWQGKPLLDILKN